MRISKVIFVSFFCLIGLAPLVWSRNQDQPLAGGAVRPNHGVPGYLDPQTGTFTAQIQTASPDVQLPGTTRILFRLIFPISININDQPAGNTTTCGVDISVFGSGETSSASDSTSTPGTASGCTVTVLAQWDLKTPATDTIFISFSVSSSGSGGSRTTTHGLASIPVPTNGQTITEPVIDTVL
jgi:hypothetical protein